MENKKELSEQVDDYEKGFNAGIENSIILIKQTSKRCLKLKKDIEKEWKEMGDTKLYSNQHFAMGEVIVLLDEIRDKIENGKRLNT